MDSKEFLYDHSYALATVIMIQELMNTVSWSAFSNLSAFQWLPFNIAWDQIRLYSTAGIIFVTVWELSIESLHPSLPSFLVVVRLRSGS